MTRAAVQRRLLEAALSSLVLVAASRAAAGSAPIRRATRAPAPRRPQTTTTPATTTAPFATSCWWSPSQVRALLPSPSRLDSNARPECAGGGRAHAAHRETRQEHRGHCQDERPGMPELSGPEPGRDRSSATRNRKSRSAPPLLCAWPCARGAAPQASAAMSSASTAWRSGAPPTAPAPRACPAPSAAAPFAARAASHSVRAPATSGPRLAAAGKRSCNGSGQLHRTSASRLTSLNRLPPRNRRRLPAAGAHAAAPLPARVRPAPGRGGAHAAAGRRGRTPTGATPPPPQCKRCPQELSPPS